MKRYVKKLFSLMLVLAMVMSILTDIKMPLMTGMELIRRCRYDYPSIKFVILSGYGEYEFTSQAMAEGVRHYVLKPCDEE